MIGLPRPRRRDGRGVVESELRVAGQRIPVTHLVDGRQSVVEGTGRRQRVALERDAVRVAAEQAAGTSSSSRCRSPSRHVDRDQLDGPRVDDLRCADEGEARAPGPALRAGAGDPPRGADARRRLRRSRVPDAEGQAIPASTLPEDAQVPSDPRCGPRFPLLVSGLGCGSRPPTRGRSSKRRRSLTWSGTRSRRPTPGRTCSSVVGGS